MSKPLGRLPATPPVALASAWSVIEDNAITSFNKYVYPHLKLMTSPIDLASLAGECGYKPAEQHALTFRGSPYEYMSSEARKLSFVQPIIVKYIKPFLVNKNYSTSECLRLIDNVLKAASCIPDFTFGNAQKWVNMSIKYYIIFLSFVDATGTSIDKITNFEDLKNLSPLQNFYEKTKFYNYLLMPIDTPMCKHVSADFGYLPAPIYTPYPWSKNNIKTEFVDYWNLISRSLSSKGWTSFIPILYEIYVW